MSTNRIEKLSILLPVFNEGESLKIMVQILKATIDFPHEILIIYDFPEDNSIPVANWLMERYDCIRPIHNTLGRGVPNALKAGLQASTGDTVLIAVVDEVFPVARIADMANLIEKGCDFVSATRYSLGGRRMGGSLVGHTLSLFANFLFCCVAGSRLSDATTGMKMIRKEIMEEIPITSEAVGWSFSFELSIKAQMKDFVLGEVPVTSVDRLFGGESTFQLGPWVKAYWKWFVWGCKELRGKKFTNEKVFVPAQYEANVRSKYHENINRKNN